VAGEDPLAALTRIVVEQPAELRVGEHRTSLGTGVGQRKACTELRLVGARLDLGRKHDEVPRPAAIRRVARLHVEHEPPDEDERRGRRRLERGHRFVARRRSGRRHVDDVRPRGQDPGERPVFVHAGIERAAVALDVQERELHAGRLGREDLLEERESLHRHALQEQAQLADHEGLVRP